MRFFIFSLVVSTVFCAVDFYVYRNWRAFAGRRRSSRVFLAVYRVLFFGMPLVLPAYAAASEWWAVEPKLLRALAIGCWALWYVPKVPIALILFLKDTARFAGWLFDWFQRALAPKPVLVAPGPGALPPDAGYLPPEAAPRTPEEPQPDDPLDLSDMKRMSRADFLRKMGWSAAGVPFVIVGYGLFRGLYDFELHEITVSVPGLPRALDGLRIAQISDLHAGSFFSPKPMREAAEIINGLRPDLITITGDYVNHDVREAGVILPALDRLRAPLGVYGCLGNHDHYAVVQDVADRVNATSVDLLINAHRTLEIDGARLHLVGTDNTGFNQRFADLPGALSGLDRHPHGEEATILLAHDPTFWDTHVRPGHPEINLMLAGHTHGGQIGIEFGPLRWGLARLVYERWAGLYREPATDGRGAQYLYVNRGLGTVGAPLRIGIPPEITLLTLRRA